MALEDELSTSEAAALYGVCTETMRRYGDRGLFGMRKLPTGVRRFSRAEIEKALQDHK